MSEKDRFTTGRTVEDGFGSVWVMCDRERCGIQVVRPGKCQCWCDESVGSLRNGSVDWPAKYEEAINSLLWSSEWQTDEMNRLDKENFQMDRRVRLLEGMLAHLHHAVVVDEISGPSADHLFAVPEMSEND